MEAPEKIYLRPLSDGETYNHWYRTDWENNCIEYIRTDAFIEKAIQYLKDHKEEVETEDNGIIGWIPDYFIENFIDFMKGE